MLVIFDFLQSIRNAVGNDCEVSVSTFDYGAEPKTMTMAIDWPKDDFHFRYRVSEHQMRTIYDIGVLENIIIQEAKYKYDNKIIS